ncbi:MAG: alkyl sulfatase dimerization domain-containing protein [Lysobacterales bacterium]
MVKPVLTALALLALSACSPPPPSPAPGVDASATVMAANARTAALADWGDPESLADARRGFIAAPSGQVRDDQGVVIWDFDAFDFVDGDPPETVNPSLWRQARLNNQIGLFEVTEGIWQLRGFDLANMTLVQGDSGWIVIDPLTSLETARTAIAFARSQLGDQPVSALIYTHSHVDHFGGALGVLSATEAAERGVPIVAPAGFLAEATSENVLVGSAMGRRASYMYGQRLSRDAKGLVDNGLGKAVAIGRMGLLPPTVVVDQPEQQLRIDGVDLVFHLVSGTEAPAEFVFALPQFKAYCGAELMSHTLHNLYTLRGAKVRDALRWADSLERARNWSADAEVLFNQHHWPVWGQPQIQHFIVMQRDSYRYIHDQTVRLLNAGLNANEIAEQLVLPPALQQHLNVRGYYGTVSHNSKAVYQFYMGWFDGHPANLQPLPPVEAGRRYVELAGGSAQLRSSAKAAFDAGDYRWAAELLKHAVLADPGDVDAAEMLAQTFEQLAYMAESAPWRNVYLSGAYELRHGGPAQGISLATMLDMLQHTPIERFLERMAASIDGPAAADLALTINLVFSDLDQSYVLRIENGVLHHRAGPPVAGANATLRLTKAFFLQMMTGQAGATDLLLSDQTDIEGSRLDLGRFFGLIEAAPGIFPIVTR